MPMLIDLHEDPNKPNNYFKVTTHLKGSGQGEKGSAIFEVFPFGESNRKERFDQALESRTRLSQQFRRGYNDHTVISIWRRHTAHSSLPVIGEAPRVIGGDAA